MYVGVWFVDVGHMVVLEHTPSLPCPILISPVHPYIFFNFLNVLVCLLFDGLWTF